MRVVSERQSEVSDVGRLIDRLRHRPDHQRLYECALRRVAHALRDRLQVPRGHGLRYAGIDAQCFKGCREALELLILRLAVHPIERRNVRLLERLGHRDVRQNHALLDEAVRIVACAQLDGAHPLAGVDDEFGFRRIEIQRTPVAARLVERAVDIDQHHERLEQRTELGARRRPAHEQRVVREGVREARRRAHHRRIEACVLEGTAAADHHVRGKAQAIDPRRERTQVIRQRGGQHRQHARGEVDRRTAPLRFGIHGTPRPHVVTHVGDRHDEAQAPGVRLGIHRIVEIARIVAIDGDERKLAQIHALVRFARIDLVTVRLRLAQRRGRKLVRQIEACDRRFGGELDRPIRVQTLADHRVGARSRAGVTRDPGDHPIAAARAVQVLRRHRTAQLQAPIRCVHPGAAPLHLHGAEKRTHPALQHLLHRARPAIGRITRHLHAQPVAVHHATHFRRRQKHAFLESLHAQEPVAGAIGADRALNERARPHVGIRRHGPSGAHARARAVARGLGPPAAPGCSAARPATAALRRRTSAAVARAELSSTRLQLTAPGPVRTFRGLPRLPGWRNW